MIRDEFKKIIDEALLAIQKEGRVKDINMQAYILEHPLELNFGDYATNAAMTLGKALKKNPKDFAELLIKKIKARKDPLIKKVEAVNGFINFFISKEALLRELEKVIKEKECYGGGDGAGKKIVVEYSSPNISKPFGIGHLRSTIIGQAIYNIYKFLGWECQGINHLGDWGTPHGKIIYMLFEKKLKGKNERETEDVLQNLTVTELEKLYVDFHKEAEKNPEIQGYAREWFKRLETGDHQARMIWQQTKTISLHEFQRIYDLLGVRIDSVWGESFYEEMLKEVVEEARKKGIARESEGALIVEYEEGKVGEKLPPAMLLKSDGATTYFTRDLAAIKFRMREFKPDVMVYETGVEQTLHFKQVFAAAKMLGWIREQKFVHVRHGFYRWEHGKFRTRSGETIHLEEVLNEAIARALKIIDASETSRGLSATEEKNVAKSVGVGGVKYNDLARNPESDIIFDWEKILNLKGASAPYIQYTYARCMSILEKARDKLGVLRWESEEGYEDFSGEEIAILRFIYRFPEVVREAAERFSPNLIANFIFDLAQAFNLFYSARKVLEAESKEARDFRLFLTQAVAQVTKNGLTLLGISAPERM